MDNDDLLQENDYDLLDEIENELKKIGNDLTQEVSRIIGELEYHRIYKYNINIQELEPFSNVSPLKLTLEFNYCGEKIHIESTKRGEVYRDLRLKIFEF